MEEAVEHLSKDPKLKKLITRVGLDALKAELTRRGAKAGGTADERAARLWRIRGLAPGAALPADLLIPPLLTVPLPSSLLESSL